MRDENGCNAAANQTASTVCVRNSVFMLSLVNCTFSSPTAPAGSRRIRAIAAPTPVFGLVDEASKLNLNTATADMLAMLPGMTVEFAAAIVDWRDNDSTPSENGAEDEVYQRLDPPRRCKNGPFESIDELRLVYGATPELLHGEDANRNGILDANENDGDVSLPTVGRPA